MSLPNSRSSARDAAPADHLMLEVIGGRHAGVYLPLDAGECSIGSAHEADVLLRDPGVAPTHVRLRLDRSVLCIEAEASRMTTRKRLLLAWPAK